MNITNPVYFDLMKYNIINDNNIKVFSNKTRDSNIKVFQDKKEKIIFLSEHKTGINYYKKVKTHDTRPVSYLSKKKMNYVFTSKGNIITKYLDDDRRRKNKFNKLFLGKDVLDFGCGWGNFLKMLKKTKSKSGIEVGEAFLKFIKNRNKSIVVKKSIFDFDKKFDYITLFHVLHYLPNQIELLKNLRKYLKKNGKIIIEVPNAKDFLLSFDNFDNFKNFTLSKEQLILHTEKSLRSFVRNAGYKSIKIEFYQRYNMNNHFGWFLHNKPGGHYFLKKFLIKQ